MSFLALLLYIGIESVNYNVNVFMVNMKLSNAIFKELNYFVTPFYKKVVTK